MLWTMKKTGMLMIPCAWEPSLENRKPWILYRKSVRKDFQVVFAGWEQIDGVKTAVYLSKKKEIKLFPVSMV